MRAFAISHFVASRAGVCKTRSSLKIPEPWVSKRSIGTIAKEVPGYATYPPPSSSIQGRMTPSQVLGLLRRENKSQAGMSLVLVDLRCHDHEGGTIRGSINLPAESLYPSIPTLYAVLRAADVRTVIWYCGHSKGRGARAAGWFNDFLVDQGDGEMASIVLEGGIQGWVAGGDDYTSFMEEYDATKWAKGQI